MKNKNEIKRICANCWGYKNPKEIRHYVTNVCTQEESDAIGWRVCPLGNLVKKISTVDCFALTQADFGAKRPRKGA